MNVRNTQSSRSSFLSDKIRSVSSLNDSRDIILEELGGTYHHGNPSSFNKSFQAT